MDAARRVRNGERVDIIVLAADVIDALAAEGHILEGSRVDLVTSAVGVAVRSGTPYPDISTAEAVRRAVLDLLAPAPRASGETLGGSVMAGFGMLHG